MCFACGKADYFVGSPSCPAKDVQCRLCSGMGHFARKCMKGGGTPTPTLQHSFDGACGGGSLSSKLLNIDLHQSTVCRCQCGQQSYVQGYVHA